MELTQNKQKLTAELSDLRLGRSRTNVFIYLLSDPRTREVRYVGKTINPRGRFFHHLSEYHGYHKCNWVRSLLKDGITPAMTIIEELPIDPPDMWREAERFWIEYLKFYGCRLTNLDNGGIGPGVMSEETRRKLSLANIGKALGRKMSKESSERKRLAMTGKIRSPEHCAKLKAVKRTDEWRANISAGLTGRRVTTEHRAAMRAAKKGTAPSKECTARLVETVKGIPLSAEHRAKISVALTGRIVTPEWLANMSKARKGMPWTAARRDAYLKSRVIFHD